MAIGRIHSFLVHPAKGEDQQPPIGGTSLPKEGLLNEMLTRIFDRAPTECDIAIAFRPDERGKRQNDCRDDFVRYIDAPTLPNGRRIAQRLQDATTHRSGLGLLFMVTGTTNSKTRLVVSRFPADQGILAEENREKLTVAFLERVFMKNAKAYKSVMYESDSTAKGFWDGRAVDRQISGPRELSDYWIREFLASELRTTGPAGTKRIAVALRSATRAAESLDARHELISAAGLLRNKDGKAVTGRKLVDQLGLSPEASEALAQQLPRPELMDETFIFEREEFEKHLMYRVVELDNGGMLITDDEDFEKVFEMTVVNEAESVVRYETQGRVVDERLRKTK